MSENTKIEWCDHTFNPWIGCTQISPACDNCYAKAFDSRFAVSGHAMHWGAGVARKRTSEANWRLPMKWNRKAEMSQNAWQIGIDLHGGDESACIAAGFIKPVRPRVFCASLADVFDNEVPIQWRMNLFSLIASTPNLDWLILTKRIGNVIPMLKDALVDASAEDQSRWSGLARWIGDWWDGKQPANVWLGATICNQTEADRDIPKLLSVPAHKRFLSMEPLLGPVDLSGNLPAERALRWYRPMLPMLDWVIVGGESGPNARPMHPDWARSLRDQCDAAGVPFLFKQWGEWREPLDGEEYDTSMGRAAKPPALIISHDGIVRCFDDVRLKNPKVVIKVGKKAAGRLLDGLEWNGVPA